MSSSHTIAVILLTLPAVFSQDACSAWLNLGCASYQGDSGSPIPCSLNNASASGNPNSFDCSLRPTNPATGLTYCTPQSVYTVSIPQEYQKNFSTLVTLAGFTAGAQISNVAEDVPLHLVTPDGTELAVGTFVPGFNAVIGSQDSLSAPLTAAVANNYPFNGVLTCSNQGTYQVWRLPQSFIQTFGVAQIKIYDANQVLKLNSITLDLCGRYPSFPTTSIGDHVNNASVSVVASYPNVRVQSSSINAWPQCIAKCVMDQQSSPDLACAGYVFNTSTQTCTLFPNRDALFANWSIVQGNTLGFVPLYPKGYSGALPSVSGANSSYSAAKMTRPDLYGSLSQFLFSYNTTDTPDRMFAFYMVDTTAYAVSASQSTFGTVNFISSWLAGRVSECGSASLQRGELCVHGQA
jgi:hypothetical protein